MSAAEVEVPVPGDSASGSGETRETIARRAMDQELIHMRELAVLYADDIRRRWLQREYASLKDTVAMRLLRRYAESER